jgi:hypothetical protein
MKTLQETFNELLIHMRALGGNKANDGVQCVYKTSDGESGCPVGRLIPTAKYNSSLEGLPAIEDSIQSILYDEGYDPLFCYNFQLIHDIYIPERWEECAYTLAKDTNLKYFFPINYTPKDGFEILDSYDLIGKLRFTKEVWEERINAWKILATAQKQTAEKLGVKYSNV